MCFRVMLFIIPLIMVLNGCKNYYITEDEGIRPKKPRYKIKPSKEDLKNIDFSLLDTNAIYLCHLDSSIFETKDTNIYVFLRFFSDGRILKSFMQEGYPTLENVTNINTGVVGYYKLNNNKLIFEIFGLIFENCQYWQYESELSKEGIWVKSSRLSKKYYLNSHKINDKYIRVPISELR